MKLTAKKTGAAIMLSGALFIGMGNAYSASCKSVDNSSGSHSCRHTHSETTSESSDNSANELNRQTADRMTNINKNGNYQTVNTYSKTSTKDIYTTQGQ